jgi:hypothetical protein
MRLVPRITIFVFLFSVLIAGIACGGGPMSSPNNNSSTQPALIFEATPSTVTNGVATILTWKASNAVSVIISGLGKFPAVGSAKVTPTVTTTYRAIAIGPSGTSVSSTVVRVMAPVEQPTLIFGAQPSSITAGESALLSWTANNATSVSIAGVGTFAATGSVQVTPTSTSTYTAMATGAGGTASSNATVTVTSVQNPPPTISFKAQPNTIKIGASAVLSWTTTYATSVNIAGLGSFPANGSTDVKPTTTTTYAATADGAGGTAKASTTVTVEANGTPLPNLQASSGWKSWGELPPNYNICAYPCPGVTWWMKQGITTPSLSGDATEFYLGGTHPYADVLFSNPLIGAYSTQGLPDSDHKLIPTLHNFTYDAYFYPTNLDLMQVLELDISMYFDGLGLIFGHQCNNLGGHVWDIWDNVNSHWVSTGIPCNPINNAWNHVTLQVQRQSDNSLLYQSITLNGKTTPINKYYAPGHSPESWWGITVNYQMDGNSKQTAYTTYLDNFTFTYW